MYFFSNSPRRKLKEASPEDFMYRQTGHQGGIEPTEWGRWSITAPITGGGRQQLHTRGGAFDQQHSGTTDTLFTLSTHHLGRKNKHRRRATWSKNIGNRSATAADLEFKELLAEYKKLRSEKDSGYSILAGADLTGKLLANTEPIPDELVQRTTARAAGQVAVESTDGTNLNTVSDSLLLMTVRFLFCAILRRPPRPRRSASAWLT